MKCKENTKTINIYVDSDIVSSDYSETKNLWSALNKLKEVSPIIKINIIGGTNQYVEFPSTYNNFEELFKSFDSITKDEVFISYSEDKLYKWDLNRGKTILAMKKNSSMMEFNKVCIDDCDDNILKKLRIYIHI